MAELFEPERFQPVGIRFAGRDRWVVLGRMHVKDADGGVELDVPLAHVVEQRDRKVARLTVYSDISLPWSRSVSTSNPLRALERTE